MDDHRFQLKRFIVNGHLSDVVARIFSKAFFTARIARHTMDCKPAGARGDSMDGGNDRRLHRLISYMHHTDEWYQGCNVGDYASDITLMIVFRRLFCGRPEGLKVNFGWHSLLSGPKYFCSYNMAL